MSLTTVPTDYRTLADIAEMIEPVDPDTLYEITPWSGQFEAFWLERNDLDIQRLKKHPGLHIDFIDVETPPAAGPQIVRFHLNIHNQIHDQP